MKWVCQLTWSDAPHLTKEQKDDLLASYSPHERDARSKGIPHLGSGMIYPIPESEIVIDPIKIPEHWPRVYAMDVGWKKTAALWAAWDPKQDIWYIYSELYLGYKEPSIIADSVKARGHWINGVIDPNSDRRSEAGGEELIKTYSKLGLSLYKANNAVDPGILEVYQKLSAGRIRIFSHLQNVLAELRIYRRDLNGKIVKKNDHLMDCLRYLIMSGQDCLELMPTEDNIETPSAPRSNSGRSNITGY
jgi:hypothetical protein